jgi:hypothetical protein
MIELAQVVDVDSDVVSVSAGRAVVASASQMKSADFLFGSGHCVV